ncbi:MAG: hypothetical protein ACKOD2_02490, partial [Ilumatobacteraceae bacterium]
VEAVGDAPELCLTPTVVAPCPQLTGTVRSLAGTTTSVTANASATDSQSNTTPFAPARWCRARTPESRRPCWT